MKISLEIRVIDSKTGKSNFMQTLLLLEKIKDKIEGHYVEVFEMKRRHSTDEHYILLEGDYIDDVFSYEELRPMVLSSDYVIIFKKTDEYGSEIQKLWAIS